MKSEERRMDYLRKLFGLEDRIAVVTGGASGLGAAFSNGLAKAGATVIVADINDELANRVVDAIGSDGGKAEFRRVDVTDVAAVEAFADDVADAHEHVDVLVNSAGAAHRSPIEDFSEEAYDRILALNLKGTYFMSQAIGRKMLAQGKGSIINIASIGGFIAYPHSSAYLCSKGGVVQATKSFALEWSGRVRVNAIAPGLCETPLLKKVLAESGSTTTTDFIQQRMLGALIQPDELVAAAIFLAGDGAAKVTGHTLAVDDGYLAQ
jgi:NAD(P)-dependent dehydrogenase (short-subunit alcohol dehydrogenase family)